MVGGHHPDAGAGLVDLQPGPERITADIIAGMSARPRRLPSKYFYDARGSALFERITHQPEYYLTRVESALLERHMEGIARAVGPRAHVVEYGSGSGRKTGELLAGLDDPVAYTPIEISRTALLDSISRLAGRFPAVQMLPVCADFTRPVQVPASARDARRALVFFPGSTLGNFTTAEGIALLRSMRQTMGSGGLALVGIDLDKDPALIEAAYNDAAGVTAQFTLNLLHRLNHEIGTDFDPDGFRHLACYVPERRRIETFLESLRAQYVHVGGRAFQIAHGERIQVEYSQKYTGADFAALIANAGLAVTHAWNDDRDWFGLRLLRPQ